MELAVPRGQKPPAWRRHAAASSAAASLEKIALTQESGKAIQHYPTVLGHLLTALVQGRPVDLARLAQRGAPRRAAADAGRVERSRAQAASGQDIPTTEKHSMTDLLGVFLPAAEKPYAERSDAENSATRGWQVHWYAAFRRVQAARRSTAPRRRSRRAGDWDGREHAGARKLLAPVLANVCGGWRVGCRRGGAAV